MPRRRAGGGDFNHSGDAIAKKIHARHRRLGWRLSLAIAALMQTVGMFLLADMRGWWHFLVMAALAMGATALIHLTRVALWCVVGMHVASYIAAYVTGHLEVPHFIHPALALWLLSFRYVHLGHHLRMTHELHI